MFLSKGVDRKKNITMDIRVQIFWKNNLQILLIEQTKKTNTFLVKTAEMK